MRLLAPLYAAGLALALAPILLHLFGRRRAPVRRFPAARLLQAALRRRAPRARLEAWLLVALRVLAVAGVAAVLARPVWDRTATLPPGAGLRQAAVIVLDDSLSMARRDHGRALFEEARTQAVDLARALADGSEVAVLGTTAPARDPLAHLERDRDRAVAALRRATVSARAGSSSAAIARAEGILAASPAAYRRIYLVSDLAASGFDGAHPRTDARGDAIGLSLVRVGSTPPPNDAIVAVDVSGAGDRDARRLRVRAHARADGGRPHARTVSLRVDGVPVARGLLALPGDGTAEKEFEYAVPDGAEPRWIEVALDPDATDALALDDARAAPVRGTGGRVVLIDGAPGAARREDETFYLETALRAARGAGAPIEVIREEALAGLALDGVAALFLCNPRPSPALAALPAFVARGGGLFVSVGDNLDAPALSAQLAGLLPSAIEAARDLRGPGGVAGGALRLAAPGAALVARVPALADERGREGWRAARTSKVALFHPLPDGADDREVLARFEDGTPALLERRVGAGRVLALATTVDRAWSDLPIQPVFPALAVELAERLGAVRGGPSEAELVRIGDAPRRTLAGAGSLELTLPDERRVRVELDARPAPAFVVEAPGRHLVRALDGDAPGPRPALTFAAETDPRESDPGILPDLDRLQTPAPDAAPTRAPAIELWHAIAALLLALLLGEALLGLRG